MRRGLAAYELLGTEDSWSMMLAQKVEGGRLVPSAGSRQALSEVEEMRDERVVPETDLLNAKTCFQRAVEVARRQQAKLWELRAVMSLCRLLKRQDRQEKARTLLTEIYGWFTEGLDTPGLQEAKALLEEL